MFCISCGKQLDEGVKFCVYCGAKIEQQVTAAPEFTPDFTSEETVQLTPPTQPAQPVQPDPAVNQNFYAQPDLGVQRFDPQQGWQTQYQQAPNGPKKKINLDGVKKLFNGGSKAIIGVAVAAVAVVALVVINFGAISNAVMKTIKSPAEYYQWAQLRAIDEYTTGLATAYADYVLDTYNSKNMTVNAKGEIKLGDGAASVLASIGAAEGVDLSWIKSVSGTAVTGTTGSDAVFNASVALNGVDVAAFNSYADLNAAIAYLNIPTISNYTLAYSFADEMRYMGDEEQMIYDSLKGGGDFAKTLPDKAAAKRLADDMVKAYIESLQTVTVQKNYKLTANGVTEKVSAYTVYYDDVSRYTFDVKGATALLNSKEFKDIIMSLDQSEAGRQILAEEGYSSASEYYSSIVEDLQDEVTRKSERLQSLYQERAGNPKYNTPEYLENSTREKLTVYINSKGEIEGYYVDEDWQYYSAIWPHNGGNFGFEYKEGYTDNEYPTPMGAITGSGKQRGSKVDGSFNLTIQGAEMMVLQVADFDIDEVKKGYVNGQFTLKPSYILASELADEMRDIPGISASISNMSVVADVKSSKNNWNVDINLMNGNSQYIGANASVSKSDDKLSKFAPTQTLNGNSNTDLYTYMQSINWDAIINNLRSAGVPSQYLDQLNQYKNYMY